MAETMLKVATVETSKASKGKGKASKASKSKVKAQSRRKLRNGDIARAGAFFVLAVAGLGVSLPHLASEIGLLTGSAALSAWLVAIVIDLGMCATKAHLSAEGPSKNVAWSVLGSCTLVSIVLNCHAFLAHSVGTFGAVAAVGFGVFLPLFILALSYLASEILLGHKD